MMSIAALPCLICHQDLLDFRLSLVSYFSERRTLQFFGLDELEVQSTQSEGTDLNLTPPIL